MLDRLCAALRLALAGGIIAVLLPAAANAATAVDCAGLAAVSAIVDALRLNGIDPLVVPPGGAEPISAALPPADSDAAQAAAAAFPLRRLEPGEAGTVAAAMVVPRKRPQGAGEVAEASAEAPVRPSIGGALSDAYRSFISNLASIARLRLDDPRNLARARQVLAKADLVSLARGWLAECSEIAARSQEFAAGVDQAASQSGADQLKGNMAREPTAALDIAGWQTASLAIRKELAKDVALMESVAFRLSEISYGRTSNEARYAADAASGNLASAAPATVPSAASLAPTPTLNARAKPMMAQMLALGAQLHLANQSTVVDAAARQMAINKDNDQCLRWAELNLNQCLAAAHDNQERAYCLGNLGIDARAKCWSWLVTAAN